MNVLLWLSIGFLFYVYLGYPLLIACSTFLRFKKEEGTLEEYPPVTMIIAAYNEGKSYPSKADECPGIGLPAHQSGDHCGGGWFG